MKLFNFTDEKYQSGFCLDTSKLTAAQQAISILNGIDETILKNYFV